MCYQAQKRKTRIFFSHNYGSYPYLSKVYGLTPIRFHEEKVERELWNYWAFMWHAVFLSITVTFTEINSVIPALILQIGGSEIHVGIVTAIMIGTPLMAQLNFAGYLHGKQRKKPFLLLGIYLRVMSLFLIALTIFFAKNMSIFIVLFLIYGELTLFTVSGAFAGVSYVDLVGKSFGGNSENVFSPASS